MQSIIKRIEELEKILKLFAEYKVQVNHESEFRQSLTPKVSTNITELLDMGTFNEVKQFTINELKHYVVNKAYDHSAHNEKMKNYYGGSEENSTSNIPSVFQTQYKVLDHHINGTCIDYAVAFRNWPLIKWFKTKLHIHVDVEAIQADHLKMLTNIPQKTQAQSATYLLGI